MSWLKGAVVIAAALLAIHWLSSGSHDIVDPANIPANMR